MKKIILLISFSLIITNTIAQNEGGDSYVYYASKIEKHSQSDNYKKLYQSSKEAIQYYPNDIYINYYYSMALFYSAENDKGEKYNNLKYNNLILGHLCKAKLYSDANTKFTKDLQEYSYDLISTSLKQYGYYRISSNLDLVFKYYDNSSDLRTNTFSEQYQDLLFSEAELLYNANIYIEADTIFNWMYKTFVNDRFNNKYSGNNPYSEDYYFLEYENPKYYLANTAKDVDYLTLQEKHLIYLHNILKIDPCLFAKTYVLLFFEQNPEKLESKPAKNLLEALKICSSTNILYPSENVFNASEFHALDAGIKGFAGHESSDGSSLEERMLRFNIKSFSENCHYGNNSEALYVLMSILIDKDSFSYINRNKVIYKNYNKIGLAIRKHKSYGSNVVIVYVD